MVSEYRKLIEELKMKTCLDLEERQHCLEKWSKCGLLRGLPEEYITDCAVALEVQRLYNECSLDSAGLAQFKRISIPVIRRVFHGLVANDLDVRCEGRVYSQWMKVDGYVFNDFRKTIKNIWTMHNLDEEADTCARICVEIADKLTEIAKLNGVHAIHLGPFGCDYSGQSYMNYELATNISHEQ